MFLDSLPHALAWNPARFWWLAPVALILDLFLGDPARLPHPVQAIGLLLGKLEAPLRRFKNLILAGALGLAAACLIAGGVAAVLVRLPWGLGLLAALYLSWAGLALGCLLRDGQAALALVAARDLPVAREAVGKLVSRDVADMDEEDLCRTLAETMSENLNDGFVAPFFWLLVAGPVGLWVYKAVSTMDSLWGYKTERWLRLGRAGAKADDALAFIPARLTALFLFLSAPLAKVPPRWPGWDHVALQARLMESPNAGWPMAAAAWLHGAGMGGLVSYQGVTVNKPALGPIGGAWTVERVAKLIRHVRIAGILGAALLWLLSVFAGWCLL